MGHRSPTPESAFRRTASGDLVPYYDRGAIEDGALDGQHLEICWLRSQTDALFIGIEGSAQIRLEDGTMMQINYDAHNGYPYLPVGRVLIERDLVPREEMSMQRIREWMHDNPEGAKDVRRQNRSMVFFRIVGLDEASRPAAPRAFRSPPAARSRSTRACMSTARRSSSRPTCRSRAPENPAVSPHHDRAGHRLGHCRACPGRLFFGAGDEAGRIAGRIQQPGRFMMLLPRELDPTTRARKCRCRR